MPKTRLRLWSQGEDPRHHEDHFFPDNWFPFAHTRQTDPLTGQMASLLRGDGFDPLIIETNTSTRGVPSRTPARCARIEPSGSERMRV